MHVPQPYLFTSPRTVAMVDRPQMAPHEGPIADPVYGYHTLWAAEVPFIPAHAGADDGDFDLASSNRITRVLQRQVRFLYNLALLPGHQSTLELRLVARPRTDGPAKVGIAFLGKAFDPDEASSKHYALDLWEKFSAIFPREAPFSYPLVPSRERERAPAAPWEAQGFIQWYDPIPLDALTGFAAIVELRKYEDWPTIRDIGGALHKRDYIAHPFVAALDYSAMARLYETLARQQRPCVVAITLRPQRLADQEIVILQELASWYQRAARGDLTVQNPIADVLRDIGSDVFDASLRTRAELGRSVYEALMREHRSLFLVRLQVIGTPTAQDDVVESLGSEVMANAGSAHPSRWTRVAATGPDELRWAHFNLQWLEFVRWGISPLVRQAPEISRLRQLVTVAEAAGAFRLPVAPSEGLAGVDVRDEPFSVPVAAHTSGQAQIRLGQVLDRGVPTGVPFVIPAATLGGRAYLFGDESASRSAALSALLRGAHHQGIPWMLIRATGAPGADLATALGARHLTIGSATTGLPLGFHPLRPPTGVPATTFVDALARVFSAVYVLDSTATIVLRRALRNLYEQPSHQGAGPPATLDAAEIAASVESACRHSDVPEEARVEVRLRCALPLRDLATSMSTLDFSARTPAEPWAASAVIETGSLGSEASATAVRAMIWAWLALAATTQLPPEAPRALLALEDAHPIFYAPSTPHPTRAGGSDVDGLAQALTRSGVGALLIDDRPQSLTLDRGGSPELLCLTTCTNRDAAQVVGDILGVSPRQRARLFRLSAGEAVVRLANGAPLIVSL